MVYSHRLTAHVDAAKAAAVRVLVQLLHRPSLLFHVSCDIETHANHFYKCLQPHVADLKVIRQSIRS